MKWLSKMRQAFVRDVATETVHQIEGRGWGKFLPPVAFRDAVYFMREDGALYRMTQDHAQGVEVITVIKERW